ncbi:MAG: sel1 repeat family protein [Betaproteobacteria bacterium]|nr:sel1 repeat family protein [Betaproteobacteria bacterium]
MRIRNWFIGRSEQNSSSYGEALDREDYGAAVPLLTEAIRQDDRRAMFVFGMMLVLGRGVERCLEDGVAWIRQAAVRGVPYAQHILGCFLVGGCGVPQNQSEAAYWLYRAERAGLAEAIKALSELNLRNPKVVRQFYSEEEVIAMARNIHRIGNQTKH